MNENLFYTLFVKGTVYTFLFETDTDNGNEIGIERQELGRIEFDTAPKFAKLHLLDVTNEWFANQLLALCLSHERLMNEALALTREYLQQILEHPESLPVNAKYGQTLFYMNVHVNDMHVIG